MAETEKRPRATRRPLRPDVPERQSLPIHGKRGKRPHWRLLRWAGGIEHEDRQGKETACWAQTVGWEDELNELLKQSDMEGDRRYQGVIVFGTIENNTVYLTPFAGFRKALSYSVSRSTLKMSSASHIHPFHVHPSIPPSLQPSIFSIKDIHPLVPLPPL